MPLIDALRSIEGATSRRAAVQACVVALSPLGFREFFTLYLPLRSVDRMRVTLEDGEGSKMAGVVDKLSSAPGPALCLLQASYTTASSFRMKRVPPAHVGVTSTDRHFFEEMKSSGLVEAIGVPVRESDGSVRVFVTFSEKEVLADAFLAARAIGHALLEKIDVLKDRQAGGASRRDNLPAYLRDIDPGDWGSETYLHERRLCRA